MSQSSINRPYVQTWLKRLGRQLRGSGRVSQLAFSLTQHHGGSQDEWSQRLREFLSGERMPTVDLIANIDRLMAKPLRSKSDAGESQGLLL